MHRGPQPGPLTCSSHQTARPVTAHSDLDQNLALTAATTNQSRFNNIKHLLACTTLCTCFMHMHTETKFTIIFITLNVFYYDLLPLFTNHSNSVEKTRKLCYRKDDRAMRPIHGCPENFRDSLTMPTDTFPTFFMGFCSD